MFTGRVLTNDCSHWHSSPESTCVYSRYRSRLDHFLTTRLRNSQQTIRGTVIRGTVIRSNRYKKINVKQGDYTTTKQIKTNNWMYRTWLFWLISWAYLLARSLSLAVLDTWDDLVECRPPSKRSLCWKTALSWNNCPLRICVFKYCNFPGSSEKVSSVSGQVSVFEINSTKLLHSMEVVLFMLLIWTRDYVTRNKRAGFLVAKSAFLQIPHRRVG